jgi:hypothetical protein
MSIGASLLMIAVGAIVVFGIDVSSPTWMDLDVIGWILMAVGALGVVLSVIFWQRRRAVVVVDDDPSTVGGARRAYRR